ncbi:MAG: hypothetical protein A3C36_04855 [Omnitrophica WOR_2 bacterium RIFCSPHIGHO2_02_FULL_52_10]|nr:MAG: hypothetical protein A3C36_04855 [Omnitrophica WOR_2 bacterium RIFCSPHIGHO2_02_FULL_52_10]
MKKLFSTLLSGFLLASSAHAAELSDIKRAQMESAILDYFYAGAQVAAVDNDAFLYVGWMFDDK